MTEEEQKAVFKEKLRSLSFRSRIPSPKVTVDRTDTSFVTTTEHWQDRQDVNVNVVEPIEVKVNKEDD